MFRQEKERHRVGRMAAALVLVIEWYCGSIIRPSFVGIHGIRVLPVGLLLAHVM